MQKRLIYLAIALIAISASFTVTASIRDDAKEVTIKGEVIDQPCYEGSNSKRGDTHKACALSCAKRGNQLAIVDEKNNVYSITGDYAANKNEKLIPFVAETVEAKGVVTEKDGKKSIVLSAIKKAESK
jgi:type 1 fimbria pilin